MTRLKNIFAVSFIAMFAVAGAHATIMTQDNIVGGTNITIDKPTSGTNAGKVVVNGPTLPTVNNATLTIQQNGTTVDSFTANASSNKTINITVPTSAADVNAVPTSRTVNGHALSSNVTVTKSDVGLGNVDNTSDANKPISTATQNALNDKENSSNKVDGTDTTIIQDSAHTDWDEYYPSMAAADALVSQRLTGLDLANSYVQQVKSGDKTALVGRDSAGNAGKVALTDLTFTSTGSGNRALSVNKAGAVASGNTGIVTGGTVYTAVDGRVAKSQGSTNANKAVITNDSGNITTGTIATGMITDEAVTSAKIKDGTITTSDISGTAGITKAQLASAVQTSLDKADSALQSHQDISGKQDKQIGAAKSGTTASTDSGKAVVVDENGKIAMSSATLKAVATSGSYNDLDGKPTIGNATLTIQRNGTTVDTFTANATSNKTINITDNDHITSATTTGSGNVVTAVTANANGALTVTKGIAAEDTDNKVAGTDTSIIQDSQQTDWNEYYPSMAGANELISQRLTGLDLANSYVQQVKSGDKTALMGRDKDGAAGKVTLTDLTFTSGSSGQRALSVDKAGAVASGNTGIVTGGTVYTEVRPSATNTQEQGYGYLQNQAVKTNLTALDTALKTIHPNTGEVKIPSGSEKATSYASIWIE